MHRQTKIITTFNFNFIMVFSDFQTRIFDEVSNTNNSIIINAVAGSGKTTTIVEALKRAKNSGKTIFLAFNKSIVAELSNRLTSNVECKTLHSLGLSAFYSMRIKVKVNNDKWMSEIRNVASTLSSIFNENDKEYYAFCGNIKSLFDLARLNLLHNGDVKVIEKLAEYHNIETLGDEAEVVNTLLQRAYDINERGLNVIDFTDMIVLPTQNSLVKRGLTKYNTIAVDEAQDMSAATQALMFASLAKNGRFIAVGDKRQAINGFAGAMCDSFAKLAEKADVELPLSVNYRCGSDIIKLAQSVVPYIESHEGAIKGNVEDVYDMTEVKHGDMVICRKSAPLVNLCLKMLASGRNAYIKGNDICEGLLNLIRKMKANDIEDLFIKLEEEEERKRQQLLKYGIKANAISNCPSIQEFADKIKCLRYIAESCSTLDEVQIKLKKLFTECQSGNCVTLSTIHKSKGLEADNVWIVSPECLPMTWDGQLDWQLEQENNLKYVAITRAKKNLFFVNCDAEDIKVG